MRPPVRLAVVLAALATSAVSAPAASADPPEVLAGNVQVTSFTPLPDLRRETGKVVHFEYDITAFLSGDVRATTSEHYTCLRNENVIRCNGDVTGTLVDAAGRPTGGTTQSHVRLTCDGTLTVCEATTHYTGVDDAGRKAVGKGTLRTVLGIGSYHFQQTRP